MKHRFREQLHSISEIETTSVLDVTLKFKILFILRPALGLKRLVIAVLAAWGWGDKTPLTCWLNRKSIHIRREANCIVGIKKRKEMEEA